MELKQLKKKLNASDQSSFNRTEMELKHALIMACDSPFYAFNRTEMELKLRFGRADVALIQAFNRTEMELKLELSGTLYQNSLAF